MTRDTYDITIRRASQLSHKLDLLRSSQASRRPSQIRKHSFVEENELRGSERTLFGSSLDSATDSVNSSRTNVHTSASCSYTNSRNDVRYDDEDDDDDDDDEEEEEDDEEEDEDTSESKTQDTIDSDKGIWEKNIHYIFLGFGVVFGIRNVTTFPSLVLQHGGGAFLFTYVVLTYTVGIPLIYLEVSLGQYARGGVVKAWGIMLLARGIYISSLLLAVVYVAFTTTTPSAWALYYVYRAFLGYGPPCTLPGNSSMPTTNFSSNHSTASSINKTALQTIEDRTVFYYQSALQVSSSISHFGHIVNHLIVALFIFWVLVFIYASLGPRLMGKLSFMFSAVPSVLLFIATIGVCTLSGSVLGIRTFLNPHWEHLNQVKTWLDSLELVLSSLVSGTGVMITLSGHCNFHGNTFRHAMLMTSMSVAMTVLSGCLMMAAMGVQSKQSGIPISNITQNSDVDLGFVLYPTVTSYLSASGFWTGIFYTSLVLLGVARTSVLVHNIHQGFLDFAHAEDVGVRWKMGVLGALVILLMSANITSVAQNGLYILRLIQQSIPRLATPIICTAQCLVVAWGYGARRFAGRVSEMTGKNKSFVWKWLWRWGCPVLLSISILVVLMKRDIMDYLPEMDNQKGWLKEIPWILPIAIVLPGMAVSGASFFRVPGTFKQRLKHLCATPVPWGPGHPEHEPQADLPDYVICHPDPFRPANALAMLTANLYLPNIVNFVGSTEKKPVDGSDMSPGYLSELGTISSSEDESSVDLPPSREGFFGRCWATLGCLSHVIGLGNIVRFPYLAYKHGGGSFLIAYLLLLLTCGLPLVVIEIAIGQFSSFGPINVWRAVPLFKGLGFCMVGISVVTSVYYAVITSWAIYYLATALTSVMPWQACDNTWNTNSCVIITHHINDCNNNLTAIPTPMPGENPCDVSNKGCKPSFCDVVNISVVNPFTLSSSADEYFYKAVTDISSGLEDTGLIRWQLILCLLLFWVIVGFCLAKSSKSGGKITYLIVLLPVSLFLILLIRCSSLPGGKQGLRHLFTPDLSRLTAGSVWRDAASQVFFSLSLGSGALIASSTYNKFNSHVFREAALVCMADTGLSVFVSLLMFAVIGAMSHQTDLPIEETVRADLGLPFVLLSHAILQLPWSLFWAALIFVSMVLCGVTTCSSALGSAVAAITEKTSLKKQRIWLVLLLVGGAFLAGTLFTFQAGFYTVELFDLHISGLPQLVVGAFTLVAFSWIYGSSRLASDLARMIKAPVGWWWRPMWVAISPGFLAACIVVALTSLVSHNDTSHIPWWGTILGILLWFILTLPILFGLVHELCVCRSGTFLQRLRRSCRPRKAWGATASRYHSDIEYFPTVHTNLGIDLNVDGLNTITDHVEFTTVGVRVPSLSQTTLLPVSPKTPRNKRPMDMRHKAILNHAYSNPQCNLSSGSLEKIGKKKKRRSGSASLNASTDSVNNNNTLVSKRSKKKSLVCNASTQTEKCCLVNKLQRQRSQPFVWVSKPVRLLARSLSWHSMRGEPAVLEVNNEHNSSNDDVQKKMAHQESLQKEITKLKYSNQHYRQAKSKDVSYLKGLNPDQQQVYETQHQKRRRVGQSVAPNLTKLTSYDGSKSDTPLLNDGAKDRRRKAKGIYKSIDSVDIELETKRKSMGRNNQSKSTSDFKELTTWDILDHSSGVEISNDKWENIKKTKSLNLIDDFIGDCDSANISIHLPLPNSDQPEAVKETGKDGFDQDTTQIPTIDISQHSSPLNVRGDFIGICGSINKHNMGPQSNPHNILVMNLNSQDARKESKGAALDFNKTVEVDDSTEQNAILNTDVIDRTRRLQDMSSVAGNVIMEEEEEEEEEEEAEGEDF